MFTLNLCLHFADYLQAFTEAPNPPTNNAQCIFPYLSNTYKFLRILFVFFVFFFPYFDYGAFTHFA